VAVESAVVPQWEGTSPLAAGLAGAMLEASGGWLALT
jgi:hypothetical protein